MAQNYVVSIDMGGTKILGALINSKSGIVATTKKPTERKTGKAKYAQALYETVEKLIEVSGVKEEQIKAICLGVPGSVNPHTGIIGLAPNLGIKNYNIKKDLQKFTKIPVLIENDVNLGALGIQKFGAAKGKKNVLVVFVGTGIGSGIILDGKLYRGTSMTAGEIGHMIVDPEGPVCGCGQFGCFEALASRTAIVRDIIPKLKKKKGGALVKTFRKTGQIKSRALAAAVEAQEKEAVWAVNRSCEVIGQVLANINNLMNFEMIVLGGGVLEALGTHMMPKIKEAFSRYTLKDPAKHVKIVESKLGDESAIYGGLALAEEFLDIKV